MLVHQGDFLNAHLYSYSVMEKCKMVLMTEKTADAFFLYSKPAGYFTKAFRSGASNDLCIQSGALSREVFEGTEKIDTARWMMVMVSGTPCLLRIMERAGSISRHLWTFSQSAAFIRTNSNLRDRLRFAAQKEKF